MSEREFDTLLTKGGFFEAPRWHDGSWYISDFYHHRVLSVAESGSVSVELEVEGQPSGLGWLPDGSMLCVSMKDHKVLRKHPDGSVTVHASLGQYCGGPLNDMVVDSKGNAWVGDFGFELMSMADPKPTNLVRVGPDGDASVAATDMLFPNGMVITDDERTLIVGETLGCRYSAFDIEEDGTLTNRRVFAQLAPTPSLGSFLEVLPKVTVGPDGCCMDANGNIWMADAIGGRVVLISEGAKVLDEIKAPDGLGFFACMLGGEDGRTLAICAAPDFLESNRMKSDDALVLTVKVEVPHGGRP
ncbi:Sugar lactone lactonase YvrE [Ferrithrix thermotolerans DSM 19514]|uniref:Sugar lactone lactonase YvrE n=1 Tax=Ferrithrix thermotolerans DSM 19514 TaxID=1121881 RepID=A0A1M4XJ22_9ACTN|nr:SMP-30/gluconolactonase/LRE family protein [Ferrithrix thermotolerans]SHE93544.1 Sugar lactone lactonase YvrE [Ferrithrix thermotolerans DSM 19514]